MLDRKQRLRRRTENSTPLRECSTGRIQVGSSQKSAQHRFAKMGRPENSSFSWIMISACLYVLSGVSQPILMAYAKHAGLGDSTCQLYMLFYYLGPATVALTLRRSPKTTLPKYELDESRKESNHYGSLTIADFMVEEYGTCLDDRIWPSRSQIKFASFIATWDIFAQSMVYAGNNLAGPTIFSIIYSSVTIWAAIYSKILLSRSLSRSQWVGVAFVVFGLSVTAMDSLSQGEHVFVGALLILVGSSLHAMTYVLSEMVMTSSLPNQSAENDSILAPSEQDSKKVLTGGNTMRFPRLRLEPISVRANCAIQGLVACLVFLLWQLLYTLPRFETLILDEMKNSGTTLIQALVIMTSISSANLLHSVTFYQTLKDFPGGATSAGVLKGLQAVLVFLVSSIALCGRIGGVEMCWTQTKLLSLIVVVFGILLYGKSTTLKMEKEGNCVQQVVLSTVENNECKESNILNI